MGGKYSFENFAVSPTNQVAYAAARAVAEEPGTAYNPLILYGGVGVGKTHLAQSVARAILEQDHDKKVVFCPGDQFTNELIESIREKSTQRFRHKYRKLDLLIIDDVQFIAGKNHVQEEFFHTFNHIISAAGQIILTSDRPPVVIKKLEDRLKSRFMGGLTVDMQAPDFELRCAILLIKAREKKIDIGIDEARVIAEQVTDSRALEGTILSIYAKTLNNGGAITLDVIEDFFEGSRRRAVAQRRITAHDIIEAVCSYYNIRKSHLKGPSRTENVAMARQVAMYLLRRELGLKYEEIAYALKRKDHTTIMHGYEKIAGLAARDPLFKQEIDRIINSLPLSTVRPD